MTPGTLNLTLKRGTDFPAVLITCRNTGGTIVPLAGWSAHAQARNKRSGALILDLAPQIAADDADGLVTIPGISHTVTAGLAEVSGAWDLVLETPEGKRLDPILAGDFTVEKIQTIP